MIQRGRVTTIKEIWCFEWRNQMINWFNIVISFDRVVCSVVGEIEVITGILNSDSREDYTDLVEKNQDKSDFHVQNSGLQ